MRNTLRMFGRSESGIAYLEFALALPLLMALFMGAVDVTRYIIIVQKIDKAVSTMSDVVAQSNTISTSQLNTLSLAVRQVMQPYPFNTNGYVIISSVTKNGTSPPTVNWQYTGGGSWTQPSQVGITGSPASWLPFVAPYNTMDDKENVIITEVYYNFVPLLANSVIPSIAVKKVAAFKPRLGTLNSLSP